MLAILVVGRATITEALEGERGLAFIETRGTMDALGELAKFHGTDQAPIIVLGANAASAPDLEDFVAAARRVHPPVRFISVGLPAPIAGVERAAAPDSTRTEWLVHIGRLPLEPPRAQPDAPRVRARRESAEEPAARPRGEESIAAALLAGSDVLGPVMARLRERIGSAGVRIVLNAGQSGAAADPLERHEAAVEVRHRARVFGRLIGPAAMIDALERESALLALWLAVQEQHAALRSAALTDPLTGAWNRRYFDRFLEASISRAKRRRNDVSLLLFDIDDFKAYNDLYGHAAGDEILRETVRLLGSVIRPTDRVCRIGGDEFAVLFDDPDGPRDPATRHPTSIVEIARRFQNQIREHRFPKLGEEAAGRLSISAGMATFPWDASDAKGLLDCADRLLLESKKQGKNALNLGPRAEPRT